MGVPLERATCVECGRPFEVRRRGILPVACSEPCRAARRRRQTRVRVERWARRVVARELLGDGSLPAA